MKESFGEYTPCTDLPLNPEDAPLEAAFLRLHRSTQSSGSQAARKNGFYIWTTPFSFLPTGSVLVNVLVLCCIGFYAG